MALFPRSLVAATIVIATGSAQAGRSHFGWLYGSDVIPERGVELETWIVEENKKGDAKIDETSLWWGVVVALTEHVELAITTEAAWERPTGQPGELALSRWGGEVRYRPQSPDPIDAGPFATLFRAGMKRLVTDRDGVRGEADGVASYQHERLFVTIDAGAVISHVPGETELEVRPGAGVSVRAYGDLRLGAETYAEVPIDSEEHAWWVIGPTISLTHGRFWGAATYGIGLTGIRDAPRLTFGVAL